MGTTGYALDDKTDLTLEYSYSRSDNFSDNSSAGLPLGLGFPTSCTPRWCQSQDQ